MVILGLNAYHGDAAACLLIDGELVAAVEEERFRRLKHWAGLPTHSVRWCLDHAGIDLSDVDRIAIGRDTSARLFDKALYALRRRPSLALLRTRAANLGRVRDVKRSLCEALEVPPERVTAQVEAVEHHRAHLASAYYPSGFERAACVSVDGFGDFSSTMIAVAEGNAIRVTGRVGFPHSLGAFYTAGTQYLGFERYGDEYKVMGLAPHGQDEYRAAMEKILRLEPGGTLRLHLDWFRHHRETIDPRWEGSEPILGRFDSSRWVEEFGPVRGADEPIETVHRNLAASIQSRAEDALLHVVRHAATLAPGAPLCIAGGCAQNSVAIGKIRELCGIDQIFVPPAAGDAGTAVGAALWVWHQVEQRPRSPLSDRVFLGPEAGPQEIRRAMEGSGLAYRWIDDPEKLVETAADELAAGRVVGWFQGRAEWGPRALGNRSLLADPRQEELRETLNRKIKRRESFRPFAPALLAERMGDWFEDASPARFMSEVRPWSRDRPAPLPAVTHVDGTARPQSVDAESHPLFHPLLRAFERRTGVPVLLNTSFNENEPLVNRPEEAIDCFRRTELDTLFVGGAWLRRSAGPEADEEP